MCCGQQVNFGLKALERRAKCITLHGSFRGRWAMILRRLILPLANRYGVGFLFYCGIAIVSALSEWVSFSVALLKVEAERRGAPSLCCCNPCQFDPIAPKLSVDAAAVERGHTHHSDERDCLCVQL